jgi:hypothetical protein
MSSTIDDTIERDDTQEHDELRALVDQALSEDARSGEVKLPLAQIVSEVGVPYGTLSAWYGRTYKGRNDRVAGAVRAWLTTREARKRVAVRTPDAPAFTRTATASPPRP